MAAKKYTYVWVSFVVLIFGILVIPSIVDRFSSGAVVTSERLSIANNSGDLAFITLNGEKRKVPPFSFYNQDSILVSDAAFIPIYYEHYIRLLQNNVHGFPQNAMEYRDFTRVFLSKK